MSQKFTSTIAGASIFISLIGVLSRGLGFIREMIFANNFGLETDFDLYLVGAVLPITISTIILYIGQNYFVPGFQKLNSTDKEAASKFYRDSFIIFVGSAILLTILLFLASDLIVKLYIGQASVKSIVLATNIFKIFIITIPFSAAVSIFSALQQAVYEFKYPAISILFLNISLIILLLLFSSKIGVYIIPIGYVTGTIFQFIYLFIKSTKILKLELRTHINKSVKIKSLFESSIITIIIIEAVSQLYTISDRYFYSQVSSGGIASLNYAYIIYYLPVSIFSISLATAIFPKITDAIINSNTKEIEKIFTDNATINIIIFMPLTFLLVYFGDTFLKIAFERGKFLEESTNITFGALKFYAVSLIFYSTYSVLNKFFYSLNFIKMLLLLTCLGILLKLIMNFILVGELQQYGLALSTSISYFFFFSASYLILGSKLKIRNKYIFIKELLLCLINAIISLLLVNIFGKIISLDGLLSDILSIFLFIGLYFINLIFVKHKAVNILYGIVQKFIPINSSS